MATQERQRIYWTKEQKQQVLDEAARLHLKFPKKKHVWLIREAQKVLDVSEQRNLKMVSWQGSFAWFPEGFDEAVERARGTPSPEDNGEPHVSIPEDEVHEESPESYEGTSQSMLEILSALVTTLEELKQGTPQKQELPIGIVGRLDQLQEKIDRLENQMQGFLTNGFMLVPTGIAFRPAPALSAPLTADGTGFTTPSVLTGPPVPRPPVSPLLVPPQQKPSQPQPPPPAPTPTRKPRVVVLNTDSGHVRNGIQKGCQGHVSQLTFAQVSELKTPEFSEFDYIMAYKKTPITWIQAAKKFYPIRRFYAVSGGAESMAEAIKKLPLIELGK